MTLRLRRLWLLGIVILLTGCAGAMVPATDDPQKKIHQAYQLLSVYRYVPARKLIDEAAHIYRDRGDLGGVAYAFTASTDYYRYTTSPAYKKYYENYVSSLAPTTPIDLADVLGPPLAPTTMEESKKAVEAYDRAITAAVSKSNHFEASNLYYRLFIHFARDWNTVEGCNALTESVKQHDLGKAADPESTVSYDTAHYASFQAQIAAKRKWMGCPSG